MRSWIVLAGILVASSFGSRALADTKIISAAGNCKAASSSQATYLHYSLTDASVGGSVPGGYLTMFCTMIRDVTTNSDGLESFDVLVNNPAGKSTFCTVASYDANGTQIDAATAATAATGIQWLHFGTAINVSAAGGFYAFGCYVPAYGSVKFYSWAE
jgi:hypothetical protein